MTRKTTKLFIFVLVFSLFFALHASLCSAKDYRYTKWDVDVTVNTDSTLSVVETLTQKFDGDYTGSFRNLMYGDNVLSYSGVSVAENGQPYQSGVVVKGVDNAPGLFSITDLKYSGNYLEVLYSFRAANQTKSFTISYRADGGFYYYDKTDRVEWKAVSEERAAPIDSVVVTLHLPKDVSFKPDYIGLQSPAKNQSKKQIDKRTVRFSGTDLGPNTQFLVGVEFRKDLVKINPALLRQQKSVEARQARERWGLIISLGLSILLVVITFLVMLLVWYRWGRDADLPPVAEYLTEPPDKTPPAVVSELVFETTDVKDINATLVDLAQRGYLKFWKKPDDTLFQWLGDQGDLRAYETQLIADLFKGQQTAELSSFKNSFFRNLPNLSKLIGQESVAMGFYKTAPAAIKKRFAWAGGLIIILGGALTCCSTGILSDQFIGSVEAVKNIILFAPPIALAAAGLIVIIFGMLMPRKTKAGAEAHARWWAFRQYLANIQKYGVTGNAQEIFEKYMAYAVAFKLEQVFTEAFTAMPTVIPPIWFAPYWYPGYPGGTVTGGGEVPATFDLNQMSESFTSTLNDVASTLTSQPSSSSGGGGFGGGGGFSGGGGGGGGSGSW